MQTAKEVLIKNCDERNSLTEKIHRLEIFMMSADFQETDSTQKELLCQQYKVMKDYANILLKRIMRGREQIKEEIQNNGTQSN